MEDGVNDRERIMAKAAQLEEWAQGLVEYQRAVRRDLEVLNQRMDLLADGVTMLGTAMDLNARKALDEDADRNGPLVTYLDVRRRQGA